MLHWDGKIVANTTEGNEKLVDRLPIVVTGGGVSKTLEIPKLKSGTGEAMAKAVFKALQRYGLEKYVIAFTYDTTRSNSGIRNGASILLNSKFSQNRLFFECRRHCAELYMGAAFETAFGKSGKHFL